MPYPRNPPQYVDVYQLRQIRVEAIQARQS